MKHFIPLKQYRDEHGGEFALNKRRARRPLNIKRPMHLVLRSDLAKGRRSLLRNQAIVHKVLRKFSRRFQIQIYEQAICGNHIHLLVKSRTRRNLQNFFRVTAGQIAQEILRQFPLQKHERKAFTGGAGGTHRKNQRTFWSFLLYSRIVKWGRDFKNVSTYVIMNMLEALRLIPYQERKSLFQRYNDVKIANSS